MKSLILSFIGVAVFILVAGMLVRKYRSDPSTPEVFNNNLQTKSVTIDEIGLTAEVADTPEKREIGLGGREDIRETEAMLFMFPDENIIPSFWMKNMKFAIDIIWINDNKIAGCEKNVQPPLTEQNEMILPLYKPRTKIDLVLETAPGFCDRYGIKVGDIVKID